MTPTQLLPPADSAAAVMVVGYYHHSAARGAPAVFARLVQVLCPDTLTSPCWILCAARDTALCRPEVGRTVSKTSKADQASLVHVCIHAWWWESHLTMCMVGPLRWGGWFHNDMPVAGCSPTHETAPMCSSCVAHARLAALSRVKALRLRDSVLHHHLQMHRAPTKP